jgi:hypothetical protein
MSGRDMLDASLFRDNNDIDGLFNLVCTLIERCDDKDDELENNEVWLKNTLKDVKDNIKVVCSEQRESEISEVVNKWEWIEMELMDKLDMVI